MTAVLQYGALGLLALVLAGLGAGAKLVLLPLVADLLATNRALREAMVSQGQRMTDVALDVRTIGDMVEDIHREVVGAKRTSDYADLRRSHRREAT